MTPDLRAATGRELEDNARIIRTARKWDAKIKIEVKRTFAPEVLLCARILTAAVLKRAVQQQQRSSTAVRIAAARQYV